MGHTFISEYLAEEEVAEVLSICNYENEEELSDSIENTMTHVFDDKTDFYTFFEEVNLTDDEEFEYVNNASYWEDSLIKISTGKLILFLD